MRLAMGQLDGILRVCQLMHNHHTQLQHRSNNASHPLVSQSPTLTWESIWILCDWQWSNLLFELKTKCSFWAPEKALNKIFHPICPRVMWKNTGKWQHALLIDVKIWDTDWWGKFEEFVNYLITAWDELSNCIITWMEKNKAGRLL